MARRRVFTAEEAYAMVCSDTESASEGDISFILSSSSSESEEEPPRRRRRVNDQSLTRAREPIWTSPTNYVPQVPDFTADAGVHVNTTGFREIDFFQLFFSDNLISLMVEQTNLYADQIICKSPTSHIAQKWIPTNARDA